MQKSYNKICVGCGRAFIAHRIDKVYHSTNCKWQDWNALRIMKESTPVSPVDKINQAKKLIKSNKSNKKSLISDNNVFLQEKLKESKNMGPVI